MNNLEMRRLIKLRKNIRKVDQWCDNLTTTLKVTQCKEISLSTMVNLTNKMVFSLFRLFTEEEIEQLRDHLGLPFITLCRYYDVISKPTQTRVYFVEVISNTVKLQQAVKNALDELECILG